MKIVSFMAATTIAVGMTLVGCSSGPGKTPEENSMKPMTPTPTVSVFTGTAEITPNMTNPTMGMITATITGISYDGTPLVDPVLAAALAELGATQEFNYSFSADLTTITLTGNLLTDLMLPEVMVQRQEMGSPLAPLVGTWMATITDPHTAEVTLEVMADPAIAPRFPFMLTVDTSPAS